MYHAPNWNEYIGKQPKKHLNPDLNDIYCLEKLTLTDLKNNPNGVLENGKNYNVFLIHLYQIPDNNLDSKWLIRLNDIFYIVIAYKDESIHTDITQLYSLDELQTLANIGKNNDH